MLDEIPEFILHSAHEVEGDLLPCGKSKKVVQRGFYVSGRCWLTSDSTLFDNRSVELERYVVSANVLIQHHQRSE